MIQLSVECFYFEHYYLSDVTTDVHLNKAVEFQAFHVITLGLQAYFPKFPVFPAFPAFQAFYQNFFVDNDLQLYNLLDLIVMTVMKKIWW